MRTIVVGYDGSRAADRALTRAVEIAEAFQARLVVLAVAEPERVSAADAGAEFLGAPLAPAGPTPVPVRVDPTTPPPPAVTEEAAQGMLDRARASVTARDIEVEYVSALGDPAESIVQAADQHQADLIVVGSREHGFLERLLGGAVEEQVARQAHRDVLLVH